MEAFPSLFPDSALSVSSILQANFLWSAIEIRYLNWFFHHLIKIVLLFSILSTPQIIHSHNTSPIFYIKIQQFLSNLHNPKYPWDYFKNEMKCLRIYRWIVIGIWVGRLSLSLNIIVWSTTIKINFELPLCCRKRERVAFVQDEVAYGAIFRPALDSI